MSQCKHTATEFIQNTFSPHIAVLCSSDAQLLCQKNNLSFVQLIQPFCRLSSEVHIRDANNVTHSIHNLRINACDMAAQPLQPNVLKKQLSDAVAGTIQQAPEPGANNMVSIGIYDVQLNASTPWYETWREAFLHVLPLSDHEYLNHCLSCIFVVSSSNPDPLGTFTTLANQQVTQQQQFPNKVPRWFCQGILHYYVLLHDVLDGEQSRADSVYQNMKATFGVQICHMLQINSRSTNTIDSIKSGGPVQPDPWSQFLHKQPSPFQETADSECLPVDDTSGFPSLLNEGNKELNSDPLADSFYDNIMEESGSSGLTSSSSCDLFSHPLASPTTPPSRDTPSPDSDPTAAAGGYLDGRHSSSSHNSHRSHRSQDSHSSKGHGMCLTPSDLDRLRIFMHEFVVRALIPWAERQMKMLSEQLTSRKGIHRSFFSVTKRFFGNKPAGPIPASQNTTVVYTKDAPELQLRRLGDLAFLFQMYEFAHQTFYTAKKEFNNDQAWLHFAGALEMACLATFLQGPQSQKQYPHHSMDTAISTYLTSCRNPQYATRATITSTEALKKKNLYQEAAMQFLKMTSEDSDLTSALFLEQAAHCFLALKMPMVRKFAFHMILAGHRFNKAGQRKHSLRAYNQALQVYKAKHWSIAEDHVHFTIGRQSFNLKQLENATASFKHLLTEESKQPTSQQAAFLREYLFVYRQLLSQEERDNSSYGHLPELPLPLVDSNATKVLLRGNNQTQGQQSGLSRKTPAMGIWFDTDIETVSKWKVLEDRILQGSKSHPQLFMDTTDNRANPLAFVGEPIHIELCVNNPLHVMLVLTEISLLWTFLPSIQGSDPAQVISNEVTTGVKNSLADEIVQTSVIKEVVVQGTLNEKIRLTLTPRQPGQLRVVGLAYNLGTSSLAQNSQLQPAGSQNKPSYTSNVFVRGKQRLEPRGPRLNASKQERTQKLYGPDSRLDLLVHEEMPSLQVVFCEFPDSVLCGEVHCIEIEFSNSGRSPLHNLKVTSSHPRFFTFGSGSKLPKYPYVYQMRSSDCSSLSSSLTGTMPEKDTCTTVPDILNIPLPKGELKPGDSVSIPFWLRGDDIGGLHDVDFLFYYEPVSHSSNIKHRVVHHRAVLNTVESLSVTACVTRPVPCVNTTTPGQELNSCIFACELENLSQVQVQRPHVQELQVTQVSCVSPGWTLVSLGSRSHQSGVRLGSRETLQLVMKGLNQDNGEDKLIFSEIALDRDQVNSSTCPCSDFYVRSMQRHKQKQLEHEISTRPSWNSGLSAAETLRKSESSLESAVLLNLTLIFLWKAYVVQESGQMRIVVGQHHVHVNRLNVHATSYPVPVVQNSKPPLKFVRPPEEEVRQSLSPEVTTRLVTYSFSHRHQMEHKFKQGMCVLTITITLQNHSHREVCVMVDTSKTPDSLSNNNTNSLPPPDGNTSTTATTTTNTTATTAHIVTSTSYSEDTTADEKVSFSVQPPQAPVTKVTNNNGVRWVGLTQASLTLAEGQSSQLSLKAGLTRPGTYNLNCVSVFVNFSSDKSQMILQKHATPSIVTVVDSS